MICHNVLEYVDAPDAALAAVARVLRPGGTVSVLAANTVAAVLQRALAGRYAEALGLLPGPVSPGTAAPGAVPPVVAGAGKAPSVTRRFTLPELTALIEGAGLRAGDAHGIRIFSGLLPGAGADPAAAEALRELEDAAATCPPLRDIAARLHVLGLSGLIAKPRSYQARSARYRPGGRPPVPPMRACGPRSPRRCSDSG